MSVRGCGLRRSRAEFGRRLHSGKVRRRLRRAEIGLRLRRARPEIRLGLAGAEIRLLRSWAGVRPGLKTTEVGLRRRGMASAQIRLRARVTVKRRPLLEWALLHGAPLRRKRLSGTIRVSWTIRRGGAFLRRRRSRGSRPITPRTLRVTGKILPTCRASGMAHRDVLIRERRLVDLAEGVTGRGIVDRHPASAADTGVSRKSRVAIQAEHLPPSKPAFSIGLILTRSRFHPISKRTVSMRIQIVSSLLLPALRPLLEPL